MKSSAPAAFPGAVLILLLLVLCLAAVLGLAAVYAAGGLPLALPVISPLPSVAALPSATRTPFQPDLRTHTPFPSRTATPTETPTPSQSPSPTPTETPTATPTASFTPSPLPPTATPTLPPPPESASVGSIIGYAQSYTLDCEARSAADLAAFFGLQFNHMSFQNSLPQSDNPETGFVGPYWGAQGRLPPEPYGVHAKPVARLLREFGLNARAQTGLDYTRLQQEIAAGRPVMVWVINHTLNGSAVSYTASDGETVLVAPFEHTVLVIAYTPDSVTLLDGEMIYTRSVDQFLSSWSVLGYQAVLVREPPLR